MSRARSVAVALSGGVDSAVTAHLLKKRGFDVVGIFMRNWDITDDHSDVVGGNDDGATYAAATTTCHVTEDVEDAKWAAEKIGIDFRVVSFVKEYWNQVFSYVMNEYEMGRTPNGDIMCNRKIKFDVFLKFARESLGVDAVATGHYVRSTAGAFLDQLDDGGETVKLLRGSDVSKDQSFFLSQVKQEALRHAMFPLGSYQKKDVKFLARSIGLRRLADKAESMGICFVGAKNFHDFILDFIPPRPGLVRYLDPPHEMVGKHRGLHTLTVGQRLSEILDDDPSTVDKRRRRVGDKLFVAKRCAESNTVFVVVGTKHPALYSDSLIVENPHWISGCSTRPDLIVADTPGDEERNFLLVGDDDDRCNDDRRHRVVDFQYNNSVPITERCLITKIDDDGLDRHRVRLSNPFRAITPGQFAVFYRGEELLGSAKTVEPGPSVYERSKVEDRNIIETLPLRA